MGQVSRRFVRSMETALYRLKIIAFGMILIPLFCLTAGRLQAQEFPTSTVKFIVPFPAGGGSDIFSRKLADVLSKDWKKPVVVENISGGANIVGIQAAIQAPADGHTVILVPDVALSLYPLMYPRLSFNPDTDLAPITTLITFPAAFVVSSKVPVNTLAEFIDYAKKTPLNYGSFGPGSAPHLHTELFKSLTKLDILHVPYRGAAPLMTGLAQGDIQMLIIGAGGVSEQIKGGTLRGLAIDGSKRSPILPDVPTFKEAGLGEMIAPNWWGLLAPSKTPKNIREKISRDIAKAMKDPLITAHLLANGNETAADTPDDLAKRIQETREFWRPIIKAADIRLE